MKTNLKGHSGIKALALLHGEKVLIAVVGLIALWFMYSALSLPKLESRYQAPSLRTQIDQTNARVQETSWPEPNSEDAEHVRIARSIERDAELSVPEPLMASNPAILNPPVVAPSILRTDPLLLNAMELRATGGSGLVPFNDEESRKKFELAQRLKEEERQRLSERQQREMQPEVQRGGQRGRQSRGGPDVYGMGEFDPDNPDRRPVEGMICQAGAPLQGGERIERVHWATVVAKVPVKEQLRLYEDAFQNAKGYDPSRDMPDYVGYIVQRAEVVRGQPLEWKEVPVQDGQRNSRPIHRLGMSLDVLQKLFEAIQQKWASGPAPDPVDPRYLDQVLSFPLPPLVGRNWGAEATHPDIPLAIHAPPEQAEELNPEASPEQPAAPEDGLDFGAALRNQLQPGAAPGPAGPLGGGHGIGPPMLPRGGFSPMREFGPEGLGSRYGSAAMPGQIGGMPRVDYKLFRFFDFTVEPGKRYRYRVKLVLRNPNSGIDKSFLAPEVLDADPKTYRMVSEWSEPSSTVGIPLSGGVRLAEVRPKSDRLANDEPVATLLMEAFDVNKQGVPIQASKEKKDFRRGYVANFIEEAWYLEPDGRYINRVEMFKFLTGMTVLDMRGGDRLSGTRDLNVPARVLLMGPAGELYIRNELDDEAAVAYHRQVFAEPDKRRRGEEGFRGPGPFGPEGAPPLPGRPGRARGPL